MPNINTSDQCSIERCVEQTISSEVIASPQGEAISCEQLRSGDRRVVPLFGGTPRDDMPLDTYTACGCDDVVGDLAPLLLTGIMGRKRGNVPDADTSGPLRDPGRKLRKEARDLLSRALKADEGQRSQFFDEYFRKMTELGGILEGQYKIRYYDEAKGAYEDGLKVAAEQKEDAWQARFRSKIEGVEQRLNIDAWFGRYDNHWAKFGRDRSLGRPIIDAVIAEGGGRTDEEILISANKAIGNRLSAVAEKYFKGHIYREERIDAIVDLMRTAAEAAAQRERPFEQIDKGSKEYWGGQVFMHESLGQMKEAAEARISLAKALQMQMKALYLGQNIGTLMELVKTIDVPELYLEGDLLIARLYEEKGRFSAALSRYVRLKKMAEQWRRSDLLSRVVEAMTPTLFRQFVDKALSRSSAVWRGLEQARKDVILTLKLKDVPLPQGISFSEKAIMAMAMDAAERIENDLTIAEMIARGELKDSISLARPFEALRPAGGRDLVKEVAERVKNRGRPSKGRKRGLKK